MSVVRITESNTLPRLRMRHIYDSQEPHASHSPAPPPCSIATFFFITLPRLVMRDPSDMQRLGMREKETSNAGYRD